MKKAQPRDTIFCAGNEKMLYPPVVGRKRVAKTIFQTNGFDSGKSKEAEVNISPAKTKNYTRRNDLSFEVATPTGLAKGIHQKDFMNQSVDFNTYGIFSSRKKIESRNNYETKYSDADFAELKYRDPLKKDRVSKYMDSTGMKNSLSITDQISIPATPRKQNLWLSSSEMKEALSTPKNGNYTPKCLNVTGKVNSTHLD